MLCAEVFRIVRGFPALKKVPRAKLQIFSLEISLIALGLRSGYLFDTFSLPRRQLEIFSQLIEVLRKSFSEFNHVVALYDENTHGFFFVNAPLLLRRCQDELELGLPEGRTSLANVHSSQARVTFVDIKLSTAPVQTSIPARLSRLLRNLLDALDADSAPDMQVPPSTTISTEEDVSAADIIPLAAVLVEYPVAYVPDTADGASFLSGVELEVYSCDLVSDDSRNGALPPRHTFMQFSCPRVLLGQTGNIEEALREKFTERVARTGLPCHLDIKSRTERLDRVAL